MNLEEIIVEKGKKNKETRCRAGDKDLRKFPFMLKDGDIIGIRVESENTLLLDDFQTQADIEAKEKFTAMQEADKKERQKNQNNSNNGKGNKKNYVEHDIVIDLEE